MLHKFIVILILLKLLILFVYSAITDDQFSLLVSNMFLIKNAYMAELGHSYQCANGIFGGSTQLIYCSCYKGWSGVRCDVPDTALSSITELNSERGCPKNFRGYECSNNHNSLFKCVKTKSPCLYNDPECFLACDCNYGNSEREYAGLSCDFSYKTIESENLDLNAAESIMPNIITEHYLATTLIHIRDYSLQDDIYIDYTEPVIPPFPDSLTDLLSVFTFLNAMFNQVSVAGDPLGFSKYLIPGIDIFPNQLYFSETPTRMNLLAASSGSSSYFIYTFHLLDKYISLNNYLTTDIQFVCSISRIYQIVNNFILSDLYNASRITSTQTFNYNKNSLETSSGCPIGSLGKECSDHGSCIDFDSTFSPIIDYKHPKICKCNSGFTGLACEYSRESTYRYLLLLRGKLKYLYNFRGSSSNISKINDLISSSTSFTCPDVLSASSITTTVTTVTNYNAVLTLIQAQINRLESLNYIEDLNKFYFNYSDIFTSGFDGSNPYQIPIDSQNSIAGVIDVTFNYLTILNSKFDMFSSLERKDIILNYIRILKNYVLPELDLKWSCNYGRYNYTKGICDCPTGFSGSYCEIKSGDSSYSPVYQLNCQYNLSNVLCGGSNSTSSSVGTCIKNNDTFEGSLSPSGYCSCPNNQFGNSCSFTFDIFNKFVSVTGILSVLYESSKASMNSIEISSFNEIILMRNYLISLNLTESATKYENLKIKRKETTDSTQSSLSVSLDNILSDTSFSNKFSMFQSAVKVANKKLVLSDSVFYYVSETNLSFSKSVDSNDSALSINLPVSNSDYQFTNSTIDPSKLTVKLNLLRDQKVRDNILRYLDLNMYYSESKIDFRVVKPIIISLKVANPSRVRCYNISINSDGSESKFLQEFSYNQESGIFSCKIYHFSVYILEDNIPNSNFKLLGLLFAIPALFIFTVEAIFYGRKSQRSDLIFSQWKKLNLVSFPLSHYFLNFSGKMRLKTSYSAIDRLKVCFFYINTLLSYIFIGYHYFHYSWLSSSLQLFFVRVALTYFIVHLAYVPLTAVFSYLASFSIIYLGVCLIGLLWKYIRLVSYFYINRYYVRSQLSRKDDQFTNRRFFIILSGGELVLYTILLVLGVIYLTFTNLYILDVFINNIVFIVLSIIGFEIGVSLFEILVNLIITFGLLTEHRLLNFKLLRGELKNNNAKKFDYNSNEDFSNFDIENDVARNDYLQSDNSTLLKDVDVDPSYFSETDQVDVGYFDDDYNN